MPTGKGAAKAFKIATATCKKKGLHDFKGGTEGEACRNKIAEGVAKSGKVKAK